MQQRAMRKRAIQQEWAIGQTMRGWFVIFMFAFALINATNAKAETLKMGFSFAKPPYVFAKSVDDTEGFRGIEIEIVKRAFELTEQRNNNKEVILWPVFLPYNSLNSEILSERIDAVATVRNELRSVYYSDDFIFFRNAAITRKNIPEISELKRLQNRNVVAWQGASVDLGEKFAEATQMAKLYVEVGNQEKQVELFLSGRANVLVIDVNIFKYYANQRNLDLDSFNYNFIFPSQTYFFVGFRDRKLRDRFNDGLQMLRASGEYEAIFEQFMAKVN